MKMILCKIDVLKIDKSRLFKGGKGTYLDFTMFEHDQTDQYGNDYVIRQAVTKEERLAGVKGLGRGWAWADFVKSDKAQQRLILDENKDVPCGCYD